MYSIEARIIENGKPVTYWGRLGGTKYKTMRRVLQAVKDFKNDPSWGDSWEFRPMHYHKNKL